MHIYANDTAPPTPSPLGLYPLSNYKQAGSALVG